MKVARGFVRILLAAAVGAAVACAVVLLVFQREDASPLRKRASELCIQQGPRLGRLIEEFKVHGVFPAGRDLRTQEGFFALYEPVHLCNQLRRSEDVVRIEDELVNTASQLRVTKDRAETVDLLEKLHALLLEMERRPLL